MISLKMITFVACLLIISNEMISASVVRDSTPCQEYCTKELDPHCVTLKDDTQKEFPNQCTYELEECKGNIVIKDVKVGGCRPPQE